MAQARGRSSTRKRSKPPAPAPVQPPDCDNAHAAGKNGGQVPAAGPCAMVIFGAGGDLTHRLLIPALYNLKRSGLLPEHFAIVGASAGKHSSRNWAADLGAALQRYGGKQAEGGGAPIDAEAWRWLEQRLRYLDLDFEHAPDYRRLARELERVAERYGTQGNVLFYLAVAPRFFPIVAQQLARAGLADRSFHPAEGLAARPWRRVIVEKPFGRDLASAQTLNRELSSLLHENQVFRIDHYLGKETVQNIMSFRFSNGLFEPIWHRDRIDHVQITAAETLGVEQRAGFYDRTGALRDMVPNHLFQLLAMVAMEPPSSFGCDAVRSRKAEVLQAIRPLRPDEAVRGQYGPGAVSGHPVRGYREEPHVSPESATETYAALKLAIDSWRWAGVPFYLRSGKRLGRRTTEIAIRFKSAPLSPFRDTAVDAFGPDWLVLQIQPDEGISLQFDVKKPGPKIELASVSMDFRYRDWFAPQANTGYETLIYDCMIGDATLFQRADMVEAAWSAVQPVLDAWGDAEARFPDYAAGSAGPVAADLLLAKDGGRSWRPIDSAVRPPGRKPKDS
jgi:glucose-6-phosphate 1-dehydrogenase